MRDMQAVEAAVSAAVADAEMRTQEEVASASAAMKAAAEAQQLRELEDKVDALQQQLASTTDAQLAAQAALTCALPLFSCAVLARSESWHLSESMAAWASMTARCCVLRLAAQHRAGCCCRRCQVIACRHSLGEARILV